MANDLNGSVFVLPRDHHADFPRTEIHGTNDFTSTEHCLSPYLQ